MRLQELAELELAAVELKRALERARMRESVDGAVGGNRLEYLLQNMEAVILGLKAMVESHPGDSASDMEELLQERKMAPGWENWITLLKQRLDAEKELQVVNSRGRR